jgi:hypothetical protein
MLLSLRNFDANRMDIDDLVEMAAYGRMIQAECTAQGVREPEWLEPSLKSVRREIASREADRKEKTLRELKARRASLLTPEEKRGQLDQQIAALEKELVPA